MRISIGIDNIVIVMPNILLSNLDNNPPRSTDAISVTIGRYHVYLKNPHTTKTNRSKYATEPHIVNSPFIVIELPLKLRPYSCAL